MTDRVFVSMILSGESVAEILAGLRKSGVFPEGRPDTIRQGVKTAPAGDDWFEVAQKQAGTFSFGKGHTFLWVRQPDLVKVSLEGFQLEPDALIEKLAPVPFELTSFASIHLVWGAGTLGESYHGPSFGDMHAPFGWGCAFRGAGHERLVSRRWLEAGPWRVVRAESDTTLVQFHAMGIDAGTALAQARVGHKRMLEGLIGAESPGELEIEGLYSKQQRKLIITTKGRPLDAKSLRTAAMVRRFQSLGKDQPIDNIVYVFVDEAEAEQHLEAMWLHGFEVRLIGNDGQERRIDQAFEPAVQRPAWALAAG